MTMAADTSAEARAAAWLAAWDAQGIHRTATDGDQRGADWLAATASALGATVTSETFALQRIDPGPSFVEFADTRIDGVPLFDAPDTRPEGVSDVAVLAYGPRAVYAPDFVEARRASTAAAWAAGLPAQAWAARRALSTISAKSLMAQALRGRRRMRSAMMPSWICVVPA